jgi:hypothetical protein
MVVFDEFGALINDKNVSSLLGRRIRTKYVGGNGTTYLHGTIVEILPRMRFGVHLDGYNGPNGPITVDLCRAEFILPKKSFI